MKGNFTRRGRGNLQYLRIVNRHTDRNACLTIMPRRTLYRRARRILEKIVYPRWIGKRASLRAALTRILGGSSKAFLLRMLREPALVAAIAAMALAPRAYAHNDPIDLSDIAAGNGGFLISGIDAEDFAGYSVSGAGDVNGDGLADVIVGAYLADPDGQTNAGESYVVFGKTDGNPVDLSAVSAGIGGFVIQGINISDYSARTVSGAGDVNGDGLADLIVGAYAADPGAKSEAGESYVVFGKSDGAAVDLEVVAAGTGGFVINGIDVLDFAGQSVSGAGDVNGDGLDDLIVGARQADPASNSQAGESYVVFGKADTAAVELSEVAAGTGGFVINGIDPFDRSGWSVSGAGDVNGDGLADLIVGANYADPGGNSQAGESYVVFGKTDGAPVQLSEVAAGSGGFILNGIDGGDQSGFRVSGAGDINRDGLDDVIVGAWLAAPGGRSRAGESYVVFGKADGDAVELADIVSGDGGFVINGIDAFDASGGSVSDAGDVDGDGRDDIFVGSFGAAPAGESYVVFGKASTAAVELSAIAAGEGGLVILGIDSGDNAGASLSGAGDVNGDGRPDLLIGASLVDGSTGESYVVFSPFPGDTVWVDLANAGAESGTFDLPFDTLAEAVAAVPAGGTVKLKAFTGENATAETPVLNKAMTIESIGGTFRIGSP